MMTFNVNHNSVHSCYNVPTKVVKTEADTHILNIKTGTVEPNLIQKAGLINILAASTDQKITKLK